MRSLDFLVLFDQAKRTERRKTKKRKEYRTFVLPGESETFSFRTGFEYDSWNRLRTMTYPDGEKVHYDYDKGGQLAVVKSDKNGIGMAYIQNISYNKFGQRDAIYYGNGTYALYSYDILQRLIGLRSYDANNEMMQDIDYVFDPVGNITDVTNYAVALQNGLGGEYDYHYAYDDLYRLVESTGNGGNNTYYNMDMAYTPNGKIKQKKVGAVGEFNGGQHNIDMSYQYSYFDGTNKLQHVYDGTVSYDRYFSWDLNGNMLLNDKGNKQQRHCWDEENRLIMARGNENAAHYMYDANGERAYKITGESHIMNINGWQQTGYAVLYDPTLYASPYVVATPRGYTKHYYAGAERIASRIGGGGLSDLRDPVVDVTDKLNNMIDRVYNGWQPHCFCFSLHEMEMLIENLGDEEINRLEELEMFVECLKNEYRVDFKLKKR